jgi:hypothetical protein
MHVSPAGSTTAATATAAAAATTPCKQRVRGQSVLYGSKPVSSALYVDQARSARLSGRIAKINAYYSPDDGCITGIKPIYGSVAGSGQLLGLQKGMKERSLLLAGHEGINRIDLKYDKR